jgi:hypothetical protein
LIKDYVERVTTVARNRVQDAEVAIILYQEEMRDVENTRSTTTKHKTILNEMLNFIGESLTDIASSDDEEDGEDQDDEEDTELGKLSEDDEPGWVMGTISKMVHHHMKRFQQEQMRLNKVI